MLVICPSLYCFAWWGRLSSYRALECHCKESYPAEIEKHQGWISLHAIYKEVQMLDKIAATRSSSE